MQHALTDASGLFKCFKFSNFSKVYYTGQNAGKLQGVYTLVACTSTL